MFFWMYSFDNYDSDKCGVSGMRLSKKVGYIISHLMNRYNPVAPFEVWHKSHVV